MCQNVSFAIHWKKKNKIAAYTPWKIIPHSLLSRVRRIYERISLGYESHQAIWYRQSAGGFFLRKPFKLHLNSDVVIQMEVGLRKKK
jgi:hypothetical protein